MTHEEHDIVDRVFVHKDAEIERLKALLTCAADALEGWHQDGKLTLDSFTREQHLIAELRKAGGEDPGKESISSKQF